MAQNGSTLSDLAGKTCKRCNKIALTGLKCINCGVVSHHSCVKHLKTVKIINETTIACCDGVIEPVKTDEELELSFGSAVDVHEENNLKDLTHLKELLKHKDIIITDLREYIDSLKKQISLLNILVNNKTPAKKNLSHIDKQQQGDNPTDVNVNVPYDLKNKKTSTKIESNLLGKDSIQTSKKGGKNSEVRVNSSKSAKTSDNVKKASASESTASATSNNHGKKKNFSKPKNSARITGTAEVTDNEIIKAAEKKAWLYVGKLSKETTAEKLRQYLTARVPLESVIIDEIPKGNGNESLAKSFKVGFDFHLLDDLTKHDLWPKGVVVKPFRFFRGQRKNQ